VPERVSERVSEREGGGHGLRFGHAPLIVGNLLNQDPKNPSVKLRNFQIT